MKIRVQFFSQLRDLAGTSGVEVEVPENCTVRDLLEIVYGKKTALRSRDDNILVGAGVEFVDRDYQLKPGEEISMMPPVQGG
jgi:molybdopterin converting factor small subunit